MNDSKVSIIVPFYNTDIRYYKKCQLSLCNQSYENLEIVVVDDGSCKASADLMDEVCKQDKRIKVLHKSNRGVSSARNIGIKEATGKYIAFVDSDDWVEPDFVETLVNILERSNAEIASVSVAEEYGNKETVTDNRHPEIKVLSRQEMYVALLTHSTNILGYLWNKLFKKELITQMLNENYHYCEDLVFNAHYLKHVNKGAASTAKLYHYRLGQGNATGSSKYNAKILTLIEAYREAEEIYKEECPSKISFIRQSILKQSLNIRARYKVCKISNAEQYTYLQNVMTEYWDAYESATLLGKVNIRLTRAFPLLSLKLKRWMLNIKHR